MIIALIAIMMSQKADTIRISTSDCRRCEISAKIIASIGDSTGPGELGANPLVVADARGRYWVTYPTSGGALIVFDSSGRLLRQVGRGGAGPGEFRFIGAMAPSRRGVEIIDNAQLRWSTYDFNLEFRGSRPSPAQARSVAASTDGRAIFGAIVQTPEAIGHPLHLVDSSGNLVRSFGAPSLPYLRGATNLFVRNVMPDDVGEMFWSSHRTEYAFEKCSSVSLSCVLYERPVPWFVPHANPVTPSREKPPVTIFVGVRPDGPRYLWSITLVPDSNWTAAIEQAPGTRTADGLRIAEPSKYWDSVIERIDLVSRTVVSSLRIDTALLNYVGPSMAYAYRETSSGVSKVDLVQLRFAGQP